MIRTIPRSYPLGMNYRRQVSSNRRYARYRAHPLRYEASTFVANASPCSSNYLRSSARPYTTPLPRVIGEYSAPSHTRCHPCRPCSSRRRPRYTPTYTVPLLSSSNEEPLTKPTQRRPSHLLGERRDSSQRKALIAQRRFSQRKVNAFLENSEITLTSHNSFRSGNLYQSSGRSGGVCKSCSSGDRYSSYRSSAGSFTGSKSSRYSRQNSNMEYVTEESVQFIEEYSDHKDGNGGYIKSDDRSESNINNEDGDKRGQTQRTSKRQQDLREAKDGIIDSDVNGNHQDEDKGKHSDSQRENSSQDQSNECRNQNSSGNNQRQSEGSFGDNGHVQKENSHNKGNRSAKTENNKTKDRQDQGALGENCKVSKNEGPRRQVTKKPAKGKANDSTEAPTRPVKKKKTKSRPPPKENGSQTKTNPNNKQGTTKTNLNNKEEKKENVNVTAMPMVQVNNQNTPWQLTTDSYETNTTYSSEQIKTKNGGNEKNKNKTRNENQHSKKNENQDKGISGGTNGACEVPSKSRNDKRNPNQNLQQGSKDLYPESNGRNAANRGGKHGNKQGKGENPIEEEEVEIEIAAEDIRDAPTDPTNESTPENTKERGKRHKCKCDGNGEMKMKSKQSKRGLPKELDFDTYFEKTFADHIHPSRSCRVKCKHKTKLSPARSLREATKSKLSMKRSQRSLLRGSANRQCGGHTEYNSYNLHDLVTKDRRFVTPREKIMTKYLLSSSESLPEVMKTKNKKTDYYMKKFEREWHQEMEILKSTRHSSQAKYNSLDFW